MRRLLTLFVLMLTLGSAQASSYLAKSQRYSSDVSYEVFRNSKPVGRYSIKFSPSDETLKVAVEMQIETKIFGLFSYDYLYQATEVWRADELESLDVRMLTNGDEETIRAVRQGEQLALVDTNGKQRELPAQLLTTHHWLDDILSQPQVLNTLNGKISRLDVKRESESVWLIGQESVNVVGYRLGGDLENTLSWYDQQGLWRGMSFKAKDGSTIEVRWSGAKILQS
ncbi:MAG: hypothetical protein HWE12_05605 [Oceanospirillaceae bacterium]|nr:hypothetical protein [Oceanospirillaceae bacterium]